MRFVAVPKLVAAVLAAAILSIAGHAEARNREDALRKANAIMRRDSELWAVRQAEEQLRGRTARLMGVGPLSPLVAAVASAVADPSRYAPPVEVKLYDENHRTAATWMMPVDGVLDPAAAETAARFFRCKRSDRTKMINRGTLALLTDVAAEFPGKTIEVVSAYRNYAGESLTSPHRAGRAIDFRVKGVSGAAVRDYMWRNYGEVGVGWYPHDEFVHVDHRPGDDDMSWTERGGVNQYHPSWAAAARRHGRDKPTS
jgi:uncharacterized protein YcbK (DUF882 family)